MILYWSTNAQDDYSYWQKHDKKILERINLLLKEIKKDPFHGVGDPEPLRNISGYFSRRINLEHRLVYKVEQNHIHIAQCRYHH